MTENTTVTDNTVTDNTVTSDELPASVPAPTNNLASTALVIALFIPVLAIGLAGGALAEIAVTRENGRGMAIAAMIIGGLIHVAATLVVIVCVVTGTRLPIPVPVVGSVVCP